MASTSDLRFTHQQLQALKPDCGGRLDLFKLLFPLGAPLTRAAVQRALREGLSPWLVIPDITEDKGAAFLAAIQASSDTWQKDADKITAKQGQTSAQLEDAYDHATRCYENRYADLVIEVFRTWLQKQPV